MNYISNLFKMNSESVFYAAQYGKIIELKDMLEQKSKDEVRALISDLTNDATPLIIACVEGHSDVVTYLLEQCQADVEQVGSVNYERGTPLYFAVNSGYLNIVKTLIKHKASVNGTKEFEAPLVTACANGNFEIVNYLIKHGADIEFIDKVGYTCLQVACSWKHYESAKYLLECGADVNRKNETCDTALHVSVISGNLRLVEMLLEKGAKSTDKDGFTPLLSAAYMGHALIVECFFEKCKYTQQERVNALKLLGAAFVDIMKTRDIMKARDCWRRALHLQYKDEAFCLGKPVDKSPLSSYIATTEVSTVDQLNKLTEDEMEINALLVTERILGPSSDKSIFNIQRRARIYAQNGSFDKSMLLWMYTFEAEMERIIDRGLDYQMERLGSLILKTLVPIIKLFNKMFKFGPVAINDPSAIFQGFILCVFKNTLKPIETALSGSQNQEDFINSHLFQEVLAILMHLLGLMCRLQPYLKLYEENSLKMAAFKLVHLNPKGRNGFTSLHIASSQYSTPFGTFTDSTDTNHFTFPSLDVVQLLLEVGACPNARDSSNNTPLHVAAMTWPCATDVFHTLLKQGAHIDLYNNENKTPLQLVTDASLLDIHPLKHLNLQCLCAQEIHKHTIPYKGTVHGKLCDFIDIHGTQ